MHPSLATNLTQRTPGGSEAALRAALLDSRQRWRALVELAGDLAFETDGEGRFTFVWPEGALGWPEASLVGQSAGTVLATPQEGFDPFAAVRPARGRSAWVRTRDGGTRLLRFSVSPLPGGHGGVRGVAADVTAAHDQADANAASLRRAEVMEHVVTCMREEMLAPRMIGTVLRAAVAAVGADGAAVVLTAEALLAGNAAPSRHETAPVPAAVLALARQAATADRLVHATAGEGVTVLACPVPERLGLASVLLFWRHTARDRRWTADDRSLALSLTGVVRAVLEQDQLLHEMSRQARTDPLTGLLNRRAFGDELDRRIARLHTGDGRAGGVLLYLDLDGFKPVNDRHGHEAGDAVLVAMAGLLRHAFRPTDLLARLGGDEFAVWLDGADELTAAERAEDLQTSVPQVAAAVLPPDAGAVRVSIGIAPADAAGTELDELLRRADRGMYAAKGMGGGAWQVVQPGVPA